MPTNLPALENALFSLFTNPGTEVECANAWGDAMLAYAVAMVPPSATVTTAATALKTALVGFGVPNQAASVVGPAFGSFATACAVGHGLTGYAPTPPGPLDLSALLGTYPPTSLAAAQGIAAAIDAWFKTGFSTLLPSGPVVPWT